MSEVLDVRAEEGLAILTLQRPEAYWVPSYRTDIIERLRLHGVRMETLDAARTVNLDMLRLVDPKLAARANEGHVGVTVTDRPTKANSASPCTCTTCGLKNSPPDRN